MKKYFTVVFLILLMPAVRAQFTPNDPGVLLTKLAASKPDTARISLLLQLAQYYFEKVNTVNRLDSLRFYIGEGQKLNDQFRVPVFQHHINMLTAKLYCVEHAREDPKKLFMPVIDTCKKTKDTAIEIRSWLALAYQLGRNPQSAPFKLTCYQNALTLSRQRHEIDFEMYAHRMLGYLYVEQGKFDLAESEFFLILKEENKINPRHIMLTSDMLAYAYMAKGEYDKSLLHALKTLKMMGVTGDSSNAGAYYGRISNVYQALGRPSESIEWAKKSVDYKIRTNKGTEVFSQISNISYLLVLQKKPQEALAFVLDRIGRKKPSTLNDQRTIQEALGDCYDALKKYDLAEKCYLEMIRLVNEQKDELTSDDKGYAYSAIGTFYYQRGNYQKALPYLETSLKNYQLWGIPTQVKTMHHWMFKVDSALGHYTEAIQHLQQSNKLNDSLFKVERNKQIEELQIAYKTEQKDKDFKILEGKQNLTQAQLQHSKSMRNWIIAGAGLLLIIAGLLYRQSLLRKKNNRIIKNKNQQLQNLVTEKEWLLKEIHHRVKNNLQIVMSLLNSQSASIDNEPALAAIHDSQHRVHAMSLIHQKLYNTDNLSSIDMSVYIRELASYLADSFNRGQRIHFEYFTAPLEMDVSQAVPLGLIINEAITNAIKYAFPGDRNGIISISLSETSSHQYLLAISDNGIGLPAGFNDQRPGSLGMSLMEGLSGDLDGSFSIENNNGTTIRVTFASDAGIKND